MAYPGSSGGMDYMKGLQELIANTNKEIGNLREGSLKGMIQSAALIRHETEHSYPATPRKLGNLVASWFSVTARAVHAGKSPNFKGNKAGEFETEHGAAIAEKRAEATSFSSSGRQILTMGYSINYAGFIHESLIARKFTPRRPAANIKWFEHHFKANKDRIVGLIRANTKIP